MSGPTSARGGRERRFVALAAAGLAVLSCGETSPGASRAYRIQSRSDTIGGPAALADVGDIMIENGVIRAAIQMEGNSVGPGMFGGSLLDVDRVRRDGEHPPGHGEDQFSELFPMVNLIIPGYEDDAGSPTRWADLEVSIVDTSGDWCATERFESGCAAVRVTGRGDRIVEALGTIGMLGVVMDMSFDTVFVLEPGKDYLRIRTDTYLRNPAGTWGDPRPMASVRSMLEANLGVFDVLVADALDPPDDQTWAPGLMAGDFLMFGKKVDIFSDGHGYDYGNVFQRAFDAGADTLGHPLASDALVGVGHGVSYGYASTDGPTIVPIFTGSFTGVFTHWLRCAVDDATCVAGMRGVHRYERVLTVGRGDVASALAPLYRLGGVETGTLAGHVRDPVDGRPISDARVFVVKDPGGEFAATAERLFERNRAVRGDPGILSELRTDLMGDEVRDGSFSGPVPVGTYYVVVRVPGRALSKPVRVRVPDGGTEEVSLAAGRAGALAYEVHDDTGAFSPAKLTLVGPLSDGDPCGAGAATPGLTAQSAARSLPLGGGEMPDRIAALAFTTTGTGTLAIEPGRYDLWISRGFEFSVDRRCVDVPASGVARVVGRVAREVDTSGWISGDFHMHGLNSYDAETLHETRVASAVAEGVDLVTMTDHDFLTDLAPTVREMGLEHRLGTVVGEEVTPVEIAHFIGFPLRYDHLSPEHGAVDWTRRDACLLDPSLERCNFGGAAGFALPLDPGEIAAGLEALTAPGSARIVRMVPHPRDGFFGYFDQFGLNHFTGDFDSAGLIRGQHPLLADPQQFFSWDFDAIELFNSKRFEMIRTPTVREVTGFGHDLAQARAGTGGEPAVAAVHGVWGRQVLTRTTEEQRALRMDRTPACLASSDCASGEFCNTQRFVCLPESATCRSDGECATDEVCLQEERPGHCVAACGGDDDCRVDAYCGESGGRQRCLPRRCTADEDPDSPEVPCVQNGSVASEGVIDDWFRLLNHGIVFAGLGNSDSHSLSTLETGCPRTYVASPTDDPGAIDVNAVVDAIRPVFAEDGSLLRGPRVMATYGPFIELFVEGQPIGSVVWATGPTVSGEARVRWPGWFDVDRVEIYRNGTLIREAAPGSPRQGVLFVPFEDTLPTREDGSAMDAWYVAVAMGVGTESRSMSPVYTATRHPNLGFSQVVAVTFASIDYPLLQSVVPPPLPVPEMLPVIPYGVTNPVFVDADDRPGFQGPLGVLPARRHPAAGGAGLSPDLDRVAPGPPLVWSERARVQRVHIELRSFLGGDG